MLWKLDVQICRVLCCEWDESSKERFHAPTLTSRELPASTPAEMRLLMKDFATAGC